MLREQRAALSSRTNFLPSRTQEGPDSDTQPYLSGHEPNLHATHHTNDSPSSIGKYNTDDDTSISLDFLPSLSFDDLQSSIEFASNDLEADHSTRSVATSAQGTMAGKQSEVTGMALAETRASLTGQGATGARPARAASLRRQSTSTRQSTASTTNTNGTGSMDPPSAPLTMRARRQSAYPPISGSAASHVAKAPRRSIGPGVVDTEGTKPAQRRRPSLSTTGASQGLSEAGTASTRVNTGAAPSYTDGARGLTASRAAKTKSLQPVSRNGQRLLSTNTSTPDHNRSSSFAGRSPGKSNGRGTTTPSSSTTRMSIVPGTSTASHATGLGARTVSPTDARRAKRLSTLQGPPPMPNTPPTPQPDLPTKRTSSRSPSMLPRKVPTPSSSRTTPDLNRKSYSSGLSHTSTASFNTARTSTGSLQPRLSQLPSSSRLPTLKPSNIHINNGNTAEGADVPPVPAIPKAYESPKESDLDVPFFNRRKSSMPFDSRSINSTSTTSLSGRNSIREVPQNDREPKLRKKVSSDMEQHQTATPVKTKNLQPLRLPPLNLLPISNPTAANSGAQAVTTPSSERHTPSSRPNRTKTPSTPMTASKSSFFSRKRADTKTEKSIAHMRSSSSIHYTASESVQPDVDHSESKPIPISGRQPRQAVSPFVSSSLPKNSGEHSFMPRSNTSGDFARFDTTAEPQRPPRLTGPRAPKLSRPPVEAETPNQISSPEDPPTPSSGTSLRRKLSLGWKRSTSKSQNNLSHAANVRDSEYAPPPPKHDNMPPPRLPASVTMNSLSSHTAPSPSSPAMKSTTFLDSKRRKSSTSSLNVFSNHDRNKSDSWNTQTSPKKDDTRSERPSVAGRGSVMHKMLNPKPSTSSLREADHWIVDLDKDDLIAEEEMKKHASRRKETEQAARVLDGLRKRATAKPRVDPQHAKQHTDLNVFERGEIVDFPDVYFTGTPQAQKHVGQVSEDLQNFGYDDDRGDYGIVPGDHLSYRYEIIDILGKGSFGQVVRCIDHKTGVLVAVKIIRNKKRFHQQALVEVNILQKLREWDPKNKFSMVNFTQSFYFRGHLCISTELLDMNLYELIRTNSFRGFSLKIVRRFTKQLLNSLLLLKLHKVIHCDLKPENILLAHPMHSEIKVIDFGSSCFESEKVYTYIQSRFYRSPEVILGLTYGLPIDMWSVGCILAELYSGVPIFPGENEQEQLACIMEIFGPPEKHLIEKSTRRKLFFDSLGKPRLTVSSKGRRRRPSSKTLQQVLKCEDEPFLDFLTKCLRWDPERRMKPDEAVRHEFITGQKSGMQPAGSRMNTSRQTSPIKRNNTITTPGGNRPLPEPPATSFKNGAAIRHVSGTSPTKPVTLSASTSSRRMSTIGAPGIVAAANKRLSTGPNLAAAPGAAGSGLPRVTRSVSARQDAGMASSAAGLAMASTKRA